ncbi:hypothetical protein QAD02_009745 [Eretmocerus hayati]|uniref:Uncharacterized protein n=1 Tax=Eretmocerus hayati TaxID=131215 RepID=A0ACC2NCM0_9HYME|nr:hypothetical protein QAD02_009745 [Eretmocerus hayati]
MKRQTFVLACFLQFLGVFCDSRASFEYLSFVVSIQIKGDHQCSGSIYSVRNVLTSAECLKNFDESNLQDLTIKVGNISDFETSTKAYSVKAIYLPENYHKNLGNRSAHNLALIRLIEPIEPRFEAVSGDVRADQLAMFNFATENITHRPKTMKGWQMTDTGLRLTSHRLSFVSKADCAKKLGLEVLMDDILCSKVSSKNLPKEYFGGPAMDHTRQMGVTLWSENYNENESLVVYTDIGPNSQWLRDALA